MSKPYIDSNGKITSTGNTMSEIIWEWIKYQLRDWL
jgi:hypothetical protein